MSFENPTLGKAPLISIIIPVFNIETELGDCLESIARQTFSAENFEVIIVDDKSTDASRQIGANYCAAHTNSTLLKRDSSAGPGMARNTGLDYARGEYILFLDGDDFLAPWALSSLAQSVCKEKPDLVTYNWSYCQTLEQALNSAPESYQALRRDLNKISSDTDSMTRRYLSMQCDGSVIYTIGKRALFENNAIRFAAGLHEDIAVLFKMHYFSTSTLLLDQVLYLKRNRPGSIVNTLKAAHIDGMFNAWFDMKSFLIDQKGQVTFKQYQSEYNSGVLGALSVLLDKTFRMQYDQQGELLDILGMIGERCLHYFPEVVQASNLPNNTRYDKLAGCFLRILSKAQKIERMQAMQFQQLYTDQFARQQVVSEKRI